MSVIAATMDRVPPVLSECACPSFGRRILAGFRKGLAFFWKYFLGMIYCQSAIGGVLIVGWTYRLVQRSVLKRWWRMSGFRRSGQGYKAFLESHDRTRAMVHWPNWVVESDFMNVVGRRTRQNPGLWKGTIALGKSLVHSLWLNFRIGLRGILNTWVLTLPGCILWLFGWYDGWNNSFNKGYEQAAVGPLLGWLGVLLFIIAMLYVPMAQVRQAATGNWRSFYQFRVVWRLVRQKWFMCMLLAGLYSLAYLPVAILKMAPISFSDNPAIMDHSNAQIIEFLQAYFFWASVVVFPAYVSLRLVAARIYASALVRTVQNGKVPIAALQPEEKEDLERLGLLTVREERRLPWPLRLFAWAVRSGVKTATVFIWFIFVSQIFIAEFFNYHPGKGWLNQTLVQLPWFHDIPYDQLK